MSAGDDGHEPDTDSLENTPLLPDQPADDDEKPLIIDFDCEAGTPSDPQEPLLPPAQDVEAGPRDERCPRQRLGVVPLVIGVLILALSTISGDIDVTVLPQPADPANPDEPAHLRIRTQSGSVKVSFAVPEAANLSGG
ncbi:hypothetical protein PHISP_00969 [Aspergillus sp. HF37]|nr:hypothetical protein PHISP_00969 [Aspergillus sp. HF37]